MDELAITIYLCVHVANAKSVDKGHHKKASSVKPTKTPKSIVEQFRGLPADDLAFIEQLDKQFQMHGEKVKIKVERDNTTQTAKGTNGKNSKRTIDGSLSYGYHHNPNHPQHQEFYFSKPRYEIFPYSQEDNHHGLRHSYSKPEGHTTVEITQSQGYEIKEVPEEYPQHYGNHNHIRFPGHSASGHGQVQTQEEVPVIVLKVPGPSKYAAHLKTLLQQYLEIRAAQVIRELEEQEHAAAAAAYQQQQQHHQQQHFRASQPHPLNHGLQTHVQYATPASDIAEDHQLYHHHQQAQHQQYQQHSYHSSHGHHIEADTQAHQGHPVYGVPTSPAPETNHQEYVPAEYQGHTQAGQTVYEDHQTHYVQSQPELNQQEYYPQQQQSQEQVYHQQPHIQYAQEEEHHQHHHQVQEEPAQQYNYQAASHQHHSQQAQLETPENYPDEKHTRVVFTKNLAKRPHHHHNRQHQQPEPLVIIAASHEQQQQQPQDHGVYKGPSYLPTPAPASEEQYDHAQLENVQGEHEHHHQQEHIQQHQYQEYDQPAAPTPGPFITITQKRKMNRVPFNYHAHGRVSTPPPRKRETPYTEDQFNKFSKLVNRLKKKQAMGMMHERAKKSPSEQANKSERQQ